MFNEQEKGNLIVLVKAGMKTLNLTGKELIAVGILIDKLELMKTMEGNTEEVKVEDVIVSDEEKAGQE